MGDIIAQINKIREINQQHKLVIFVGAGVSKNSGVCSWWELVRDMAEAIGYNNCDKCMMKHLVCAECGEDLELCSYDNYNCSYKYNFSTDDFLKIPQYFFDVKGKTAYYDFLKERFCKPFTPNEIDKLIIELNPEHIITTNYDHLLENVKHPNRSKFKKIKNDKDMLGEYGSHYIIKMHGDVDEVEKIVLKEDDYLNYSQNHILIETYIKSLLIDKTFLFIGYSLNDNNLRLIMSYIDYFAKENNIKRSLHYMTTNNIPNQNRDIAYWQNKGIELVDLSQINKTMKENSRCDSLNKEEAKLLYSFLKYIKDEKIPYSYDDTNYIIRQLLKKIESVKMFKYVGYSTFLKICNFSNPVYRMGEIVNILNYNEYKLFESILNGADESSKQIRLFFIGANICRIEGYDQHGNWFHFDMPEIYHEDDELFMLSLKNQYTEIIKKLESTTDNIEKAYYYSLIYMTKENKCQEILSLVGKEINSLDYQQLSDAEKYKIALFECNSILLMQLSLIQTPKERWDRFTELLDNASVQNNAFRCIKELFEGDGKIINELNGYLVKHEEYYMKKSTLTKLGGPIYGELLNLRYIVYDYYFFYKKNHIMLDWFNNAEKICEPYVKAILCTYYPDEYQYSENRAFDRTYVEPYPLTLMDIDIIVKHTNYKNFKNWVSYYKVFSLKLDEGIDIAELFENFCISMKTFWNIYLNDKLKVFSILISLVELTAEQKNCILKAFIKLVTPDIESEGAAMLCNCLNSIWTFVDKQYEDNENYAKLLRLLINEDLAQNLLDGKSAYEKLIDKLWCYADEEIYNLCNNMIINQSNDNQESGRIKSYLVFEYHKILLKFNKLYWRNWIIDNLNNYWLEEVYEYVLRDTIEYNDKVNDYYQYKLEKLYTDDSAKGVYSYPDNKINAINAIIIFLLSGRISKIEDIKFLEKYTKDSDYLYFLFYPDSFDYSKITTADYMWCNFINNSKYRDLILKHKSEFWTKDDEKRISLGFGSNFENRCTYKYLFD